MSISRSDDDLADRHVVDEHVVEALLDLVGVDPLAHRQVALRVEVDAEHPVAGLGEGDGEVQGGGRLGDPALLVGEGDHVGVLDRHLRLGLLRPQLHAGEGAIRSRGIIRSGSSARSASGAAQRLLSRAAARRGASTLPRRPRARRLSAGGVEEAPRPQLARTRRPRPRQDPRAGRSRPRRPDSALGHGFLHPLELLDDRMRLVDRRRAAWTCSCGLGIPLRGYSHGRPLFLPPLEIARNHPIPELLDKRLVFVTGKGGVGKTTVAVALGLRAAAEGKRTIVCEVSSQENASRMFEHTEVGFHEVEMEENLWSISIDPDESMREYVLLQLKVRAMRDMLFRSRIFNYLAAATPGLKELVTIGKIWELAQLDRKVKTGRKYDLVIVDAPATGHGIGFLQTPRTFAAIARVGPIHSQAAAARPLHHRPRAHRRRDRRPAGGDAGQRVGGAGARPARRGRRRRRPRLHQRPLPGALLQGGGRAARRAGRRRGRRRAGGGARGRSPSTAAPAPSAPSSPACGAGSRRRSRPCPSSSSPSSASRRRAGSRRRLG